MKRRKNISLLILFGVIIFILAGCSSTKTKNFSSNIKKNRIMPTPGLYKCKTYEEAGKLMLSSIIKGIEEGNYALYSRDFTKENKKFFTEKIFKQASLAINRQLGRLKHKKFLGSWTKGKFHIMLWKAKFSKSKDDILIQLYIIEDKQSNYKIAAVRFI